MSQTLYQFTGDRLGPLEWCDPVRGEILVADSWRVENGHAVAIRRHLDRFSASAKDHALSTSHLEAFYSHVLGHIPREGSWFPRIELVHTPGGPTLRYRERPAPAWSTTAVLQTTTDDPRTQPLTKGPDLEALLALRASVSDTGATEAAILAPDGTLVEGAYSTLAIWLPDAEEITFPPAHHPRIPSVTESVVRDFAKTEGVKVVERALKVSDLAGADIWVLSALHGIRLVTELVGGPLLRVDVSRRDKWQKLWRSEAKAF